jgi:CheY-like chemotaxis protein
MPTHRPILLVEDNPNDSELMLATLRAAGFGGGVTVIHDGAAALDFLRRRGKFADRAPGQPAFVLLDVLMPRVHGLEVLRQIRADPATHRLPVIMVTGVDDRLNAYARFESPHTAFAVKPLTAAALLSFTTRLGCPPVPGTPPPQPGSHPQSASP